MFNHFNLKTQFVGLPTIFFEQLDSTQLYLKELAKTTKLTEGTAVLTRFQSNGHGQNNSTWISSPSKNLMVTYFFLPTWIKLSEINLFNMAMALATLHFIKYHLEMEVFIKWPNDIIVDNKKIAGLLMESVVHKNRIDKLFVGIGININQDAFPHNLKKATSFKIQKNISYHLDEMYASLCQFIESYYLKLKNNQIEILESYQNFLFSKNGLVTLNFINQEKTYCILKHVDKKGFIHVEINGKTHAYSHGEVRLEF